MFLDRKEGRIRRSSTPDFDDPVPWYWGLDFSHVCGHSHPRHAGGLPAKSKLTDKRMVVISKGLGSKGEQRSLWAAVNGGLKWGVSLPTLFCPGSIFPLASPAR